MRLVGVWAFALAKIFDIKLEIPLEAAHFGM
jgi:hypothetical protein